MANKQVYNPYGNNPTGQFIDRFQGVHNDGLGTNIQPSLVDYAQNADDRWRGAVQKRKGFTKYLSKGFPIYSFSNVFDGFYFQGDDDVWYRSDALLDYRRRPGSGGDPSYPPFTLTTYSGYLASASSSSPVTFTGSPPVGCGGYVGTGVDTWRFRHIAQSIDQRRVDLGLAVSGLPLNTPDASITYLDINNARAFIEALCPSYLKRSASITGDTTAANTYYADYHAVLIDTMLGGLSTAPAQEWTNITNLGTTVYRADMLASDQIKDINYFEMEVVLLTLIYQWVLSSTTYLTTNPQLVSVSIPSVPVLLTALYCDSRNDADPYFQDTFAPANYILNKRSSLGGLPIYHTSTASQRLITSQSAKLDTVLSSYSNIKIYLRYQGGVPPLCQHIVSTYSAKVYSADANLGRRIRD